MNLGEFANFLVDSARRHHDQFVSEIVPKFQGQQINDEVVRGLLQPYLDAVQVKLLPDTALRLKKCFDHFVPCAVEIVRRDTHMNEARGESVLDEKWADALLVSFVNGACTPLDLGLYTCDLKE